MSLHTDNDSYTFSAVIDRIEGEQTRYAVIELPDLSHIIVSLEYLPKGVREGDSLTINISRDETDRENRIEEIRRIQEDLTREDR